MIQVLKIILNQKEKGQQLKQLKVKFQVMEVLLILVPKLITLNFMMIKVLILEFMPKEGQQL